MLTPSPAAADGSYYTASHNYYEADALGDPYWFGKGAETLGLHGNLGPRDFQKMLDGKLPDGTVLGHGAGEDRKHFSGWDLTFSAPKSVSIVAMVGGDKRLIDAVHEAAKEAVSWMEEKAAYSRFGEAGKVVARPTGNLVTAMFMHDLTREQEPGIHVHTVTMNATQGPGGEWRSLDGRYFYGLQKEGGLIFRQALAILVRQLGHEIDVDTRDGTFEISSVPKGLRDSFSTRSQQIIAKLAEQGLTRETATPQQKQAASIATRGRKEQNIDRVAMAKIWQQTLREHGFSVSGTPNGTAAQNGDGQGGPQAEINKAALEAVRLAAQVLAERQTVFSDKKLIDRAAIFATGHANRRDLRSAVQQLEKENVLQARQAEQFDRAQGGHIKVQGWTTTEAVHIEKDLIHAEGDGRRSQSRIAAFSESHRWVDQAANAGTHWDSDHRLALYGLLTTENRIVALDGTLERASNRQVVSSYIERVREQGFDVRLLAPSTAGALLNQPAATIASQLIERRPGPPKQRGRMAPFKVPGLPRMRLPAPKTPEPKPQIWLVADTSQLRPVAARDLFQAAEKQKARVVLMNEDRVANKTTSSSIRNLLQSGMTHFRMPGHQGHDRNEMHMAVAALARGEPTVAFEHIEKAGGRIVSIGPKSRSVQDQKAALQQRRDYIANRYTSLDDDQRATTRVLDLTTKGKEALNAEIRQRLIANGELGDSTLRAEILIAKFMTPTERTIPVSYAPGDVIRFGSAHRETEGRPAIERGDYFRVADVQASKGTVMLQADDGRTVAWEPAQWGAGSASVFRTGERELAVGDQIVWTRTDTVIGVRAQQRETVVNVHPESGTVSVERGGELIDIDVTKARHFDHAYADTLGKVVPAEHVIAHVPADNVELANLRALVDVAVNAKQVTIVTENHARLAQAAEDRKGVEPASMDGPTGVPAVTLDAVRTAIDILSERSSVFSNDHLLEEATKQGLGVADQAGIEQAVTAFAGAGELIRRESETLDPDTWSFVAADGWTTPEGMRDEQKMLDAEKRGRFAFDGKAILERTDAISLVQHMARQAEPGREWNPEQHVAAVGLLSSPHRVTGLQGLAGTAKTTSILKTLAGAAKGKGHEVMAIAPTTDAALKLGEALGTTDVVAMAPPADATSLSWEVSGTNDAKTVARHLSQVNRVSPADTDRSPVWLVDEASMVSARDMRTLIRSAEQHQARLFLVFDVLQLGSVGAGRAAGQLIENKMTTHYLDRIVRQSGAPNMLRAVYDLIDKNPSHAVRHIVKGGSKVLELEKEEERHAAIAKEYVARSPAFRAQTIVIDPTRAGVRDVSKAIREALNDAKELTGKPIEATLLEDANLTTPERATPTSYRQDQVVRFPQRTNLGQRQIVEAGSYLTVDNVRGAEVVLRDKDGKTFTWEPRAGRPTVEVYHQEKKEIQVGEQIRWTRNNESIEAVSGRLAKVVAIDPKSNKIEIQHPSKEAYKGARHWINLEDRRHQHFDYGWAFTTQRAQGTTAHPIMHMPSWRINTVNITSALVMMTRTPDKVVMMTDDRRKLVRALGERDGRNEAALDQVMPTAGEAEREVRRMAAERAAEIFQKPREATPQMQNLQSKTPEHVASRDMGGRDR